MVRWTCPGINEVVSRELSLIAWSQTCYFDETVELHRNSNEVGGIHFPT